MRADKPCVDRDTRLRPSVHVRYRRLDGDLVMVDLDRGEYFALDTVGAHMWELLVSGKSPGEVARALAPEYDVSEIEMVRDCIKLADELISKGLLDAGVP